MTVEFHRRRGLGLEFLRIVIRAGYVGLVTRFLAVGNETRLVVTFFFALSACLPRMCMCDVVRFLWWLLCGLDVGLCGWMVLYVMGVKVMFESDRARRSGGLDRC